MKAQSKVLIAMAVVGVLALATVRIFNGASASTPTAPPKDAAPKPALTVLTELPQSTTWARTLSANGTITAWQEASIGAELSGLRLSEVRVNVGDTVTRGQVLAVFTTETIAAELAQARANLGAAEARLSEATSDAEGGRRLRSTGALSEQRITQLITAEATARAELVVRAAAFALAQVRLRQTRVVAPDAGVISARTAAVGAVSAAGQELFRLIRQGRLEWRAEVASHELAMLQPGAIANVQGPAGTSVQGTVRMVAPNVDSQSRLGLIYVDLPQGTVLRAGMFAKGEFELGRVPVLTVPQSAVLLRDGFSYVFGVGTDRRVSQIKVQTGRRRGERIEIIGLAADAALVKSGVGFLNDGDVVKVLEGQQLLADN